MHNFSSQTDGALVFAAQLRAITGFQRLAYEVVESLLRHYSVPLQSEKEARLFFLGALLLNQLRFEGHACLDLKHWAGRSYLPPAATNSPSATAPVSISLPPLEEWRAFFLTLGRRVSAFSSPLLRLEPAALKSVSLENTSSSVSKMHSTTVSAPLIFEDQRRLYFHKFYHYEKGIQNNLKRRLSSTPSGATPATLAATKQNEAKLLFEALLSFSSPQAAPSSNAAQFYSRLSAALSAGNFTLLSGGPGTGKTTAIIHLLLWRLCQSPQLKIGLFAPTGKAANRLQAVLRTFSTHQLARWSSSKKTSSPRFKNAPAVLAALSVLQPITLHRFLRRAHSDSPARSRFNPSSSQAPLELTVIDEASMLSLPLFAQVLSVLGTGGQLLLVGDKEQLASVGIGTLLSDLIDGVSGTLENKPPAPTTPQVSSKRKWPPYSRHGALVLLHRNYRAAAPLVASGVEAIQAQAEARFFALLEKAHPSLRLEENYSPTTFAAQFFKSQLSHYCKFFQLAKQGVKQKAALFTCFKKLLLLSSHRKGDLGVVALNEKIDALVWSHFFAAEPNLNWGQSGGYPGRPFLITKNNYALQLFNGDLGIALPNLSGELLVYFENFSNGIAPSRLFESELAYALSIHKSQGSEAEQVSVVFPSAAKLVAEDPFLTRELLYTAFSRAKKGVQLFVKRDLLKAMFSKRVQRHSGLADRLRQ